MPRKWHHGHSLIAGLALGLLLARHELPLIGGALVAGILIGRLWGAAAWAAGAVAHWHAGRAARRRRPPLVDPDAITFTARIRELEEQLRRALEELRHRRNDVPF